jgi:hypothetical protein
MAYTRGTCCRSIRHEPSLITKGPVEDGRWGLRCGGVCGRGGRVGAAIGGGWEEAEGRKATYHGLRSVHGWSALLIASPPLPFPRSFPQPFPPFLSAPVFSISRIFHYPATRIAPVPSFPSLYEISL